MEREIKQNRAHLDQRRCMGLHSECKGVRCFYFSPRHLPPVGGLHKTRTSPLPFPTHFRPLVFVSDQTKPYKPVSLSPPWYDTSCSLTVTKFQQARPAGEGPRKSLMSTSQPAGARTVCIHSQIYKKKKSDVAYLLFLASPLPSPRN